ncbi:MAG: type II toxin-antitoxin system VapC family toxin [Bacteroidota bacterium]|nr:type II toxin-antitoxin system VapC family toxin [Bacteroidota bacterium]
MENSNMVIDTSIFIEYLRAKVKTNTELFKIPENSNLYISSVTLYELLVGATNENKTKDIVLLTEDLIVLPFDQEVCFEASKIYHQLRLSNQMIEFRDIFIASTCIVNNLPIKTLNYKHFERISNLELIL